MGELLDLAIEAHGGMKRWSEVSKASARATLGGSLWTLKGQPEANEVRFVADLHRQRVEYWPVDASGTHGVYEPDRTTLETDGSRVLDTRLYPRTSFAGHTLTTPWDALQLLYFSGYAMWNYLTTPFLFREPGIETHEIEPWQENGETWRRLAVTFPPHVHTHSPGQIFYFDATGLLRRQDYSVDIIGSGTTAANYVTQHQTVGGIVLTTGRRVYGRGPDNHPIRDFLAVAIDLHELTLD